MSTPSLILRLSWSGGLWGKWGFYMFLFGPQTPRELLRPDAAPILHTSVMRFTVGFGGHGMEF